MLQKWNRHAPMAFIAAGIVLPQLAHAHGFAGDRFFPPTITTDDPFAADELALPSVSYFKNPASEEGPASRQTDTSFEFDKLIIPHLSLGISDGHSWIQPVGDKTTNGWQNLALSAKYELFIDAPHEFILSVGVEAELGGTGSKSIDRDSFTTFTPTLFFGKGMGDLPTTLDPLRPVVVTGTLGQSFPTSAQTPNTLEWGLSLQYQLPYLNQHITALPAPFKSMIPLVEFSGETTENRGPSLTTGTINPGVLFETKYFQVGVEALIPINRDSGENVGAVFQIWWFLDDIEPRLFGKPLFFGCNS